MTLHDQRVDNAEMLPAKCPSTGITRTRTRSSSSRIRSATGAEMIIDYSHLLGAGGSGRLNGA